MNIAAEPFMRGFEQDSHFQLFTILVFKFNAFSNILSSLELDYHCFICSLIMHKHRSEHARNI